MVGRLAQLSLLSSSSGVFSLIVPVSSRIEGADERGLGLGEEVGKGVELLAHQRGLLAPARDLAVEGVEEEAKRQKGEGEPDVVHVGGVA